MKHNPKRHTLHPLTLNPKPILRGYFKAQAPVRRPGSGEPPSSCSQTYPKLRCNVDGFRL